MVYEQIHAAFFDSPRGGSYRGAARRVMGGHGSSIIRPRFHQRFGITPSGGRSSPASGWPGTSDPLCRHLEAWLPGKPRIGGVARPGPAVRPLAGSMYAPRRQKHGLMNAGWGGAIKVFALPTCRGPARAVARRRPLWGDASFASVAHALRSGCIVAAVRSASVGMLLEPSGAVGADQRRWKWLLSLGGRTGRCCRCRRRRNPPSTCASRWR